MAKFTHIAKTQAKYGHATSLCGRRVGQYNFTTEANATCTKCKVESVLRTPQPDVCVENHGTVFLVRPLTDAANEWIEENIAYPVWFGGALAVEHRYVRDLAVGMISDGLVVV